MVAQDAEGAGSVAEASGDVLRWGSLDEEGAEGLVLPLSRRGRLEEELGLIR